MCPELRNQITDTLNKNCVHGFKGSGVQGYILVLGLHFRRIFTRKATVSSGLILNLKPNWQLLGEMNSCNDNFGSSMPSLS